MFITFKAFISIFLCENIRGAIVGESKKKKPVFYTMALCHKLTGKLF